MSQPEGGATEYYTAEPSEAGHPCSLRELFPLILAGLIAITLFMALFMPSQHHHHHKKSPDDAPDEDAEQQKAFAVSSSHLSGASATLANTRPADGWVSPSGNHYAMHNTGFRNLIEQIAKLNNQVDTTVQTEREQVNNGKESLEQNAAELQAAIPIAESLYFSGPTGPVLAHNFEIAVSSAAMRSATATTNDMHDKATKHAETLMALAQHYDLLSPGGPLPAQYWLSQRMAGHSCDRDPVHPPV
ncbi:MAG: hypothetical protein K2Q25_02545 [Mycobacteriaceae bacterium]|nr:hypothetical protein [Mycobacteriaceae bacterium]